jgi:hypothetical protein
MNRFAMHLAVATLTAMLCSGFYVSAETTKTRPNAKSSLESSYKSWGDDCAMDDEDACKKLRMACAKENLSPCYHLAGALGFQGQVQDQIDYLTQACDWGHSKSCAAIPNARRGLKQKNTEDSGLTAENYRMEMERQRLEMEAQRLELQRRQVEVMERAEESERQQRNYQMLNQYFETWRQPASAPVQAPKSTNCESSPRYDIYGKFLGFSTHCQ